MEDKTLIDTARIAWNRLSAVFDDRQYEEGSEDFAIFYAALIEKLFDKEELS